MTRRKALAILAVITSPMASWRGVSAQHRGPKPGPAWLTIDLNQWSGMTVKLGNEEVHLRSIDILTALKEI